MSRRTDYYRYLESAHWRQLRKQAFERDGYRCVKCGCINNLTGHHIRYRKVLTDCTVKDIQTLCYDCHDALHKENKRQRKLNRKPRIADRLVWLVWKFDAEL